LIRAFLIVFFAIMLLKSAAGQVLHYEVVRNGKPIGTVDVVRTIENGIETYSLENVVEFKVLFTFNIKYVLKEQFKDGMLISGEGFNTLNGSTQKKTSIDFKNGKYKLIIDGIEGYVESGDTIKYAASQVYHQEPRGNEKMYSQYFGRYLQFKKIGDHKYSLSSPDGDNIYEYQNGFCTKVHVSRDYASFSIVMKPESLADVKRNGYQSPRK